MHIPMLKRAGPVARCHEGLLEKTPTNNAKMSFNVWCSEATHSVESSHFPSFHFLSIWDILIELIERFVKTTAT